MHAEGSTVPGQKPNLQGSALGHVTPAPTDTPAKSARCASSITGRSQAGGRSPQERAHGTAAALLRLPYQVVVVKLVVNMPSGQLA